MFSTVVDGLAHKIHTNGSHKSHNSRQQSRYQCTDHTLAIVEKVLAEGLGGSERTCFLEVPGFHLKAAHSHPCKWDSRLFVCSLCYAAGMHAVNSWHRMCGSKAVSGHLGSSQYKVHTVALCCGALEIVERQLSPFVFNNRTSCVLQVLPVWCTHQFMRLPTDIEDHNKLTAAAIEMRYSIY